MLNRFTVGLLAAVAAWGIPAVLSAQEMAGARSLRMELTNVGQLIVRAAPTTTGEEAVSQLLLEKPGGRLHLLASLEALDFVRLLKGDLNGDQAPEVVAVARSRSGEDEMPWVFGGGSDLVQLFPPREEDNPLIGRDITILPTPQGTALGVKVLVNVHDYGPPDLYNFEFYRFRGGKLDKVGEQLVEGAHPNQRLNLAGWAFQRGDFLKALSGYQTFMAAGDVATMPVGAKAEALFGVAECRKFLKDISGAIALFDQVVQDYSQTPSAQEARREAEFLRSNQAASQALSLFIDVAQLERIERGAEALALLDRKSPELPVSSMDEHLLILRGEILTGLGRSDEALAMFRQFLSRFPGSTSRLRVEGILAELDGQPDQEGEE